MTISGVAFLLVVVVVLIGSLLPISKVSVSGQELVWSVLLKVVLEVGLSSG